MHICVSRFTSYTQASMLFLSVLGSIVSVTGCGNPRPEVGLSESAVIDEQCEFFDVNGQVQICHHTDSVTHPYTSIRTSVQGCINGHAGHELDYVAVDDPTCQGGACLPVTAPCDSTLPCCDGLTCQDATCVVASTCPCAGHAAWDAALAATNPSCNVQSGIIQISFDNSNGSALASIGPGGARCVAFIGMDGVLMRDLSLADAEDCFAQLAALCP